MMTYCSDPSSRWHAEAIAYVTPRKHALAAALAKHGPEHPGVTRVSYSVRCPVVAGPLRTGAFRAALVRLGRGVQTLNSRAR